MVAAPYCAKLLADLGAEVLKVEEPRVGDPARSRGPFPDDRPHPERSALFLYLNTSKRSITLDPTTDAGRRILRELVANVDVLIEDFPPGELEGLGLDYPRLERLNPRLVMTSITPFGQTGSHRDYRSHHLNLYHSSGQTIFYASDGEEQRPPPKGGGYLGEYDGGLIAAVGTMGAVLECATTGRGQHVDVSKQEAMMALERVELGRLANDPNQNRWRPTVGGMTRAADGHFIITPIQNNQWLGLVRAMGDPEWAQEEWCQDEVERMKNSERIRPEIEKWAAGLTRDEIYHRAQAEGTPVGPVRDVAEVRDWDQARERGFFAELDHQEAGRQSYPTAAYRFSQTPWSGAPAPLLGQHNEEVYCGTLGYTREDLIRLSASGVI
jgi:crotonobetainyl-CoA:carnitine CoA-transferase CaiB-like acyl-CoA transferase